MKKSLQEQLDAVRPHLSAAIEDSTEITKEAEQLAAAYISNVSSPSPQSEPVFNQPHPSTSADPNATQAAAKPTPAPQAPAQPAPAHPPMPHTAQRWDGKDRRTKNPAEKDHLSITGETGSMYVSLTPEERALVVEYLLKKNKLSLHKDGWALAGQVASTVLAVLSITIAAMTIHKGLKSASEA